jgi:hypothetical protein
MSLFPYVGGKHQHPWRVINRSATALQVEGPIPPCPSRSCGNMRFLEGNISTVSEAISERWANHGNCGQIGAMIVPPARDWRSFVVRSSRRDHGGLQQLFSWR